jgi:regulator of replication initiation timing
MRNSKSVIANLIKENRKLQIKLDKLESKNRKLEVKAFKLEIKSLKQVRQIIELRDQLSSKTLEKVLTSKLERT